MLLFQHDGVTPTMIIYGSKEKILGIFCSNIKEASCHMNQTERYYTYYNSSENSIRYLKKGSGRKNIKSVEPSTLWYNVCIWRNTSIQILHKNCLC